MSVGDDLLDAIAAAPDDPAARLVYADHRLGFYQSDAHGELIVVQERLAELEATGLWRDRFSVETETLRARETSLISAVSLALDVRNLDATWRRGFIETLSVSAFTPGYIGARIHHPAFRVVRTLRFHGPDVSLSGLEDVLAATVRRVEDDHQGRSLSRLPRIDEVRTMLGPTERAFDLPRLERLELYDLDRGYGDDHEREEDALQYQRELVRLMPQLPPVRHLVIETRYPLTRATVAAFSQYRYPEALESLVLHAAGEDVHRTLAGLGPPFHHVRLEPLPLRDPDLAARAHANIAHARFEAGRFAEAARHYDEALTLAEGRYPGVAAAYDEAARAAGIRRRPTDPDPARDGLADRVPALLRWRQIDRVLAAAPNHRGAWALEGLRRRADLELDEAEDAFRRALDGEENAEALAKAYAVMLEDPPAALASLNRAAPGLEANVLFACIHALQSKPEIALGLLRDDPEPLARLAVGIFERQRGEPAVGRELWHELARVPYGALDPARWVITVFAATLASNDAYHRRRAFHDWLEKAAWHRPRAHLVFDALVRVAGHVMPQVDTTIVSREVDRLRGA